MYFSPWMKYVCDRVAPVCLLEIRNRKSGNRLWCTDMNCFRRNLFLSLDMDINYKYFFQFNLHSPIYFHIHMRSLSEHRLVSSLCMYSSLFMTMLKYSFRWMLVMWKTHSVLCVCVFPSGAVSSPAHTRAELHASFGSLCAPGLFNPGL